MRRCCPLPLVAILVLAFGACGSDGPAEPSGACRAAPPLVALQPLAGGLVRTADAGACFRLGGAGAHYLVVPQFAVEGDGSERSTFSVTAAFPASVGVVASAAPGPIAARLSGGTSGAQQRLDRTLRERERRLSAPAPRAAQGTGGPSRSRAAAALDSARDFQLLQSLDGDKFTTVRATLRYTGTNVAVYVDVAAPSGGFSDSDLKRFGDQFDQTLYAIDVDAFGPPSDIDNNGHVLVVITPRVNALTDAAACRTDGFVSGYFYGVDLAPRERGSNKGELFFTIAPDPAATVSCAHTAAQVSALAPATFIHEFQHMISYNQHKLRRGGNDEAVWLNEGMSHIAEELGSLYYEAKYPAPLGRANPTQLFPDSSQTFLSPNLINAYNFLANTRDNSVTSFKEFGTLQERGAAWLFLRWLVDQKGRGVLRRLEETTRTGTANVAAAAGEPFETLFADFGVAVWTDSIPGRPRAAVPARYRFSSRNLRAIFNRLGVTGSVPARYPVRLTALGGGTPVARDMKVGTADFLDVRVPAESASVQLRFAPGASDMGFGSALRAQVAVFRLPE